MATIAQKEWKQYIAQLRKINDKAVEEFETWVIKNMGYAHIERQKLIDYAYGIATKYGEASAALSSSMYDTIADMSGVSVPAALPAETASYQDVCKTVNGIIKKTGNTKILAQGIGRLVKMAGTDTILSNAYRDRPRGKGSKKRHSGAKVAWIPSGDTCPFCLMLASKGWQNQTVWGANNHSEHIHANCDCTYAVKFNDSVDYAGYDPDEYKAIYDNAEGKTRDEKFRSMNRQYRAENKDKINAQKRANYALKSKRGAADIGGGVPVKYDEKASFAVNIPDYSEKINQQLSLATRKVAEYGSKADYEYASIIDLEAAKEVDFGTSKSYNSVNSYYDFLNNNPDGHFALVHNHNTESGISLPDVQEIAMWKNLDVVIAATNNGITHTIISNGVKSNEYLPLEFESVGKDITDRVQREKKQVQEALKKYSKGKVITHDGRTSKNN